MSKENNFTKAVKELLGEKDKEVTASVSTNPTTANLSESSQQLMSKIEVKSEIRPEVKKEFIKTDSPTYINAATIINGSIITKTDIVIDGCVTGNVVTEKNIKISGKVNGDVNGSIVSVNGGYVVGNITAVSSVTTDYKSVIVGDITAESFTSNGKVKGNLKISSEVILNNDAVICGDVTAGEIGIKEGAVIRGHLQIASPDSDDEAVFDYKKETE